MTVSYQLGIQPRWILVDLSARFAGGGKLYHWSNLDKGVVKDVFQTPDNSLPWPNPILFDANGTQGPFYFVFDDGDPTNTYFLQAFDANNNLLWTQENYTAQSGSSGGGGGSTNLHLKDLIINGVFWRSDVSPTVGDILYPSPVPDDTIICPGAHAGYPQVAIETGYTALSDVRFFKDSASTADDNIQVLKFLTGDNPFILSGDITPEYYLQYTCLNAPVPETHKYIQWPINSQVNTMDNQTFIGSIWARCTSGSNTLNIYYYQFYGSPAPPATSKSRVLITTITNIPNTWTKYTFSGTFDPALGSIEGACGDSATFLQVELPLELATVMQICKPTLYLGEQLPLFEFSTNDEIDMQISSPRCGDIRVSLNAFAPYGWILCNDGVIGNDPTVITPPVGIPIARYNNDTFCLFALLWPIGQANPSYAQIYDSTGAASTWTNIKDDFAANKQIQITKMLGNALASAGLSSLGTTTWNVGQTGGSEEVTLIANNLPAHVHPGDGGQDFIMTGSGIQFSGSGAQFGAAPNTGSNVTTNTPISVTQATTFLNVFLHL